MKGLWAKDTAGCLRVVLVKVSGEPHLLWPKPISTSRTYVYRDQLESIHHHDDQNNHVQFDPQRTDYALHELGQKPPISRRPNCRSLIVRGFDRPFLMRRLLTIDLTTDDPRDFRAACIAGALRRQIRLETAISF
jgi:hypothetical protein